MSRLDARAGVGIALVVLGVLVLGLELAPTPTYIGRYAWPVFVILPGVALIAVGATVRGVSGLVIPGAIITITGLVLAVQNTFGWWATWAYAWALVAPGGVGIGLMLQGWVLQSPALRTIGARLAALGVGLFAVFGFIFEGLLHVSGFDFGPWGRLLVPAALILAGLVLLIRRAFGSARRGGGEIAASR